MNKSLLIRILLVLFLLFSWSILQAQSDTIPIENQGTEEYDMWNYGMTFRFDAGAFIPLDNLNNTLSTSPHLALYFGFPITEKYRIDLGASIFIPINYNRLEYSISDTILTGNPSLSGTMGLWVTRIHRFNNKYFWDNRIGTGLGFFQTDIKTNKPKDENDSVYSSETIFLNIGTGIRKIVLRKRSIGLAANYFYVPYNLFEKHLSSNFGNQYMTISISYTF